MPAEDARNSEKASVKRLRVDEPAMYIIRVLGELNENWSERLSGLTILSYTTMLRDGLNVTTLTGKLQDQTELVGVLNTLYGLRLPLLSVEYLGYPTQPDEPPRLEERQHPNVEVR